MHAHHLRPTIARSPSARCLGAKAAGATSAQAEFRRALSKSGGTALDAVNRRADWRSASATPTNARSVIICEARRRRAEIPHGRRVKQTEGGINAWNRHVGRHGGSQLRCRRTRAADAAAGIRPFMPICSNRVLSRRRAPDCTYVGTRDLRRRPEYHASGDGRKTLMAIESTGTGRAWNEPHS